MIFHEIYSSYFCAVSDIIEKSFSGELDRKSMENIIRERSFSESSINISGALKSGKWPLISDDYKTVLKNKPTMPVTTLEKRWLKTLLNDPKIKLFSPDIQGLEDVEPLYGRETFLYFDRYSDADPFEDEKYILNFRAVLQAIKEKRSISLIFSDASDIEHNNICIPLKMEYSSKDDKFRLIAFSEGENITVNISRIHKITLLSPYTLPENGIPQKEKKEAVVLIEDKNNALNRALIHFSYLEKETSYLSDNHYKMTIRYFEEDETEVIIQILSFGPRLKVISPDEFANKIKARIKEQKSLLQK